MSERIRSLRNFMVVFFILLGILAIISPEQFRTLIDVFYQTGDLIVVLLVIAVIVYFLRRVEEI